MPLTPQLLQPLLSQVELLENLTQRFFACVNQSGTKAVELLYKNGETTSTTRTFDKKVISLSSACNDSGSRAFSAYLLQNGNGLSIEVYYNLGSAQTIELGTYPDLDSSELKIIAASSDTKDTITVALPGKHVRVLKNDSGTSNGWETKKTYTNADDFASFSGSNFQATAIANLTATTPKADVYFKSDNSSTTTKTTTEAHPISKQLGISNLVMSGMTADFNQLGSGLAAISGYGKTWLSRQASVLEVALVRAIKDEYNQSHYPHITNQRLLSPYSWTSF